MPIAPDPKLYNFKANETLDLPLSIGTRYGCSVRGDFGGGLFAMQHLNNGVGILYEGGSFEENGGIWIFVMDNLTRFQLIGATDPDLDLRVVQMKV